MILLNVLLIWAILLLFRGIRNKSAPSVLLCGIWGFNGKDGKKADMKKLLILGLYNRTRGVDSCGYYYNGNIVKGVDKESDFKDFIITNRITSGDLLNETAMFHARKSTYGAHSLENAHPHEVGNYVQTHNGTIKNIWSLCTNHGINHTQIHVDSLGLAHIIEKDGFGVLNEYEGHASLTMVFKDDPKSLYLYHGAAREKKDETIWEERPLYYLETAEGLYYSSMEESLVIISNYKQKPKTLPHNGVYLIQNGNVVKNAFPVSRDDMNLPKYEVEKKDWAGQYGRVYILENGKVKEKGNIGELPFKDNEMFNGGILKEARPLEYLGCDIYYQYGRYFSSQTIFVDKKPVFTEVLLNGVYVINREGKILFDNETSNSKYETYYFIRGCMIRDKQAYNRIVLMYPDIFENTVRNTAYALSNVSKYPVTYLPGECTGVVKEMSEQWYQYNKPFTGIFEPKFSDRSYSIKYGHLSSIHNKNSEDRCYGTTLFEIADYVNGQICLESINNQLVFKKEDNKIEKNMEDFPFVTYVQENVSYWSGVQILESDILKIPETFYVYLEVFLLNKEADSFTDTFKSSDGVSSLLLYLITNKKTISSHFADIAYLEEFLDVKNIKECFKMYSSEEILMLENRYSRLDFISLEEECKASSSVYPLTPIIDIYSVLNNRAVIDDSLGSKELQEYTQKLTDMADDFQKKDDNESQDKAFRMYKTVDRLIALKVGNYVGLRNEGACVNGKISSIHTHSIVYNNEHKVGSVNNPLYAVKSENSGQIYYGFGSEITKK